MAWVKWWYSVERRGIRTAPSARRGEGGCALPQIDCEMRLNGDLASVGKCRADYLARADPYIPILLLFRRCRWTRDHYG